MAADEKVVFYSADTDIEHPRFPFKYEDDTLWTTQKIMGALFDVEPNTINYHLQEIFKSEELEEDSVTRIFRITAADG